MPFDQEDRNFIDKTALSQAVEYRELGTLAVQFDFDIGSGFPRFGDQTADDCASVANFDLLGNALFQASQRGSDGLMRVGVDRKTLVLSREPDLIWADFAGEIGI